MFSLIFQVYYYYPFSIVSDPAKLYNDLRWNVTRPQGFEAVMRVRCSQVSCGPSNDSLSFFPTVSYSFEFICIHFFRAFKFKSTVGTFANEFQQMLTYPGFVYFPQIICLKKVSFLVIIFILLMHCTCTLKPPP